MIDGLEYAESHCFRHKSIQHAVQELEPQLHPPPDTTISEFSFDSGYPWGLLYVHWF